MPPRGTPYGRTALPTKVVDAAEYTSLSERMAQDYFKLGASHRAEQDAESLAQITLPETGITGTTGYEGMLQPETESASSTDVSGIQDSGDTSFADTQPRRTPLMAMPEAPSLPQITPRRVSEQQGQSFELPGTPEAAPVAFPTLRSGGATAQPGAASSGATAIPFSGAGSASPPSPPAGGAIDNSSRQAFVTSAWPHMLEAAGGNRDAAEMMLAAAISENGSIGTGKPIWANNFFGIKGSGDAGSVNAATHEIVGGGRQDITDTFAAYSSPTAGFRAFFDFLEANPRYERALGAYRQTGDAAQLFRDANTAGYATDPQWAQKVESIRRTQVAPIVAGVSTPAPSATQRAAEGRGLAGEMLQGITPPQFGLGDADADAICGPVLAMAFAKAEGRNPTIDEAKQMAATHGRWTSAQGMGGPEAMAQTLRAMNIPAHYAPGALDVDTIRRETQNGNPVGVNTSGHYFVVEAVDQDGRLDLGNSAKALRASGGRQWFRPNEIAGLGMGAVTGAIYKDSPSSPTPSVAVSETSMAPVAHPQTKEAMAPEQRMEHDAMALQALSFEPTAISGSDAGQAGGGEVESAAGPPVRDSYRMETVHPADPDQGPREQPYPGTVVPIQNPDGSVTTERTITVTEPELNGGAPTNIPTVWSGQVVDDDTAITNAINSGRRYVAYPTIPEAVTAAEQRSRSLGAGQMPSVGGATVPPSPPAQPSPALERREGFAPEDYSSQTIAPTPPGEPAPRMFPSLPSLVADTPDQALTAPVNRSLTPPPAITNAVTTAAAGAKRAATGLFDAATEPENAIDTVTSAGQRAAEAGLEGAATALTPPKMPTTPWEILDAAEWLRRRVDPLAPYNDIVGAAINAFGTEIGARVADAMGVPPDEIANVMGHSITGRDVGGFIGATVLDPSNYFAAGEARATARAVGPAVREGVEGAGRRITSALADNAPPPGVQHLGSGVVGNELMNATTRARVVEQPHLYPEGTPEAAVDALLRESAPLGSGRLADASGTDIANLPRSPFSPTRKLETADPARKASGLSPLPVNPGGLPSVGEVRQAVDVSLQHKDWYQQIATRAADMVGADNLPEFFTIFGITSAQTKVHDNIAATATIMRSVREMRQQGKAWPEIRASLLDMGDQVQSTYKTGPNAGQGRFDNKGKPVMEYTRRPDIPFVLASNKKRGEIVKAYETAISNVESGAKTSSYSGSFESAGQRVYDPRTTNDLWVWRGMNLTPRGVSDAAGDDEAYRVVEAILNEIAAEKGLPGHNAQAAFWATFKNLWEQAPDLADDYAKGTKSLREVLEEGSERVVDIDGTQHKLFDVPTGQAQDFDRPEVQKALAGADPALMRTPGPEKAAQMTLQYSGQGDVPRPSNLPFRLEQRAVAEGRAPTAALPMTPAELDAAGLDREQGIFPWLTIPHRVSEAGGHAVVHLPGGTSESAAYVGAAIGDALGRPVTVSAPKHGAPNVAGVTVRAAPDKIAALAAELQAAGLPHTVGTTRGVLQIPDLGADPEALAGILPQALARSGIDPSSAAALAGDVTHAAADEHRGVLEAYGHTYGSQRPPGVSGGAAGGPGPAAAAGAPATVPAAAGAAPGGVAPTRGPRSALAQDAGSGVIPRALRGLRADAFNAAQGGVLGGASESLQASEEGRDADPAEMARRALIGGGLAVAGGRFARRGPAATRALGSGVVPSGGLPEPPRGPRGTPKLPEGALPIRLTREQEIERLGLDTFPAELRPHVLAAAEAEDFGRAARRGVIPDAVSEHMADDIHRTVDDYISKSPIGQTMNAEQTRALRNVFTGQAAKVDALAREIEQAEAAGVTTDLLITRHYEEAEKLAALVPVVEGAKAEAGRGLRAWAADTRPTDPVQAAARIFEKFGGGAEGRARAIEAVKIFNQIPKDDPIAGAKFWAQVERGGTIGFTDVLTAIRYNSMLSSPRTWEVGWVGSVLQAPLKIASDVMAAASRIGSGELGEAAKGAAMGIRSGLRPLWETVWHGITSEQALAGQLPRGLAARATTPLGRAVGTVIDLPGRMVAAPDAFFTSLFTQAEKGRQAAIAAYQQGLKGAERDAFISQFMQNTPKAAQAEVDRIVDGLMLRGDMGRIGRWASGVATKDPLIGSFVAPFMKVSYRIWTQGMELTPVGAIGTAVDVARGAYRGGTPPVGVRPLAERARMNAIGIGVTGAATWQALHGNVSGIGPDDPEKREELRATGWQPYSLKIGDQWISYANWGPVAVPFALAAAYAENQQYRKPDASNEDQMFDMAKRVGMLATEQTFLSGIGTIMNAFEDPQRYLPQLLSQQVSSTIPYGSFLNTVGQSQDPYTRRPDRPADVGVAESLAQSIKGRIPINPLTPDRGDVPIAQDVLGQPVQNQQQGLMGYQPFRISPQREDESARVAQAYLDVGVDISRPPSSFTEEGVKIEMTPDQQRAYQRYMGDEIAKGFNRANNASERRRAEMLQALYEDARAKASDRIKAEIGRAEIRQRVRTGSGR